MAGANATAFFAAPHFGRRWRTNRDMSLSATALIASVLVAISAAGCIYLGFSAWAVRRLVAFRGRPQGENRPVSVLKPLCGEDPGLADNLRSFCCQNHNDFQVVFG